MSLPEVEMIELAKWIVILGFVITIWLKLRSWEKGLKGDPEKREISPQPLGVRLAAEFVRQQEFDREISRLDQDAKEIKARLRQLDEKREADKIEIISAGEERAVAIHNRINLLLEKVSEIKGEVRKG